MLVGIIKLKRSISKTCCVSSKVDVITEVFKALCVHFLLNLYSDSMGQDYCPQFTGKVPR